MFADRTLFNSVNGGKVFNMPILARIISLAQENGSELHVVNGDSLEIRNGDDIITVSGISKIGGIINIQEN